MLKASFKSPFRLGRGKCMHRNQPLGSTSEINNTTTARGVVGYSQVYLTGWRTSSNETNTYPTIHTCRLIALTGDILKENAITKGYSQIGLENLSWIRSVRSSLRTQKSVYMAKERTHYVLKSELLREEHLN